MPRSLMENHCASAWNHNESGLLNAWCCATLGAHCQDDWNRCREQGFAGVVVLFKSAYWGIKDIDEGHCQIDRIGIDFLGAREILPAIP